MFVSLELAYVCVWLDDGMVSVAKEWIDVVVEMIPNMSPERVGLL